MVKLISEEKVTMCLGNALNPHCSGELSPKALSCSLPSGTQFMAEHSKE